MPQDDIFNLEQTVHDFVDDAITKYLDNKDEPDTKHQILDRVFPVERRIASIIHGLSTSMGTRVWEKLARAIAGGNGFKIHKPKDFLKPVTMPPSIDTMISTWKQEREAGNRTFT
ncbi:MAG: TdeIII family type II restriction endonuclease, partial [Chloroflexota bacterium]